MADFMNAVNTGITSDTIWSQIVPVAPLIITVTLVGLACYVINKNLKAVKGQRSGRA